jgi:hypothetical protein
MTQPAPAPLPRVSLKEIGDLLAWCRQLTATPPEHRDPGEWAAYQATKADLLERIAAGNDSRDPDLAARARQAAAHAHAVANRETPR